MSMISMKVVKRNGTLEDVSFDKVLTRIQLASKDLEVNPTIIAQRTLLRIYDGVKTSELDELASQLSVSLITTNPDYGILASRIAISNHHRNTSDKFTDVIFHLANQTVAKTGEKISSISQELIDICKEHGEFKKRPCNHISSLQQGCPKCQIVKQHSKMSINWLKLFPKPRVVIVFGSLSTG